MSLKLIFAIIAIVCFAASAAGVSSRINLQSVGLAFFVLFFLVE